MVNLNSWMHVYMGWKIWFFVNNRSNSNIWPIHSNIVVSVSICNMHIRVNVDIRVMFCWRYYRMINVHSGVFSNLLPSFLWGMNYNIRMDVDIWGGYCRGLNFPMFMFSDIWGGFYYCVLSLFRDDDLDVVFMALTVVVMASISIRHYFNDCRC